MLASAGFENQQGLIPGELAEETMGIKTALEEGSFTDSLASSLRAEAGLEKHLGHTREIHQLILGCVPEGAGIWWDFLWG